MGGRRERRQRARAARRSGVPQPAPQLSGQVAAARKCLQAGDLDTAHRLASQALSVSPRDAEASQILGLVYYQAGHFDIARAHLEQSVKSAPKNAVNRVNLAVALQALGDRPAAIAHYRKAIVHDPSYALAYTNLGHALKETGADLIGALSAFRRALALQPDHQGARSGMVWVLQRLRTRGYDPSVAELLLDCFASPYTDHQEIGATAARQLMLKYELSCSAEEGEDIANTLPPLAALERLAPSKLASDTLLLAYFRNCMNVAVPLEELLRHLRRRILLDEEGEGADAPAPLLAAFARQGFLNEYVIHAGDDEWDRLERLRSRLEEEISSGRSAAELKRGLLTFATYASLDGVDGISRLLTAEDASDELREILRLSVADRREEDTLKIDIPSFSPIKDDASRSVRSQYEQNPYPRWTRSPTRAPSPPAAYLKRIFPFFEPPEFLLKPDLSVLVAGGGTGSHPINVARDMPQASILTFDLSLSSLAYGIRMAKTLGIGNIEFLQGDILEADRLSRRGPFDMIQCIGVLHHMKDPLAGWRVLTELLRPGGLFKVGLYSERARQGVVRCREAIRDLGIGASPREISSFRRRIIEGGIEGDFGDVLATRDFYSTSMVRDLLFHVQEHRYTPLRLKIEIEQLGLDFVGFEPFDDPTLPARYAEMFPDDPQRRNLENWEAFERKYPDAVRGYMFWCQKPK